MILLTNQKHLQQRGFSLIEIMIVAVLLAIFAGLAAINIAAVYQENQKKAVVAEAKSISEAIAFAIQDTDLFPKLNFLNQPTIGIIDPSYTQGDRVTDDFHIMGFRLSETARRKVARKWKGPYLGSSRPTASSSPTAIGRRGFIRMKIKSPVITPVDSSDATVVAWPADLWGNPYVAYLMKVDTATGTVSFVENATESANFRVVLASYGPDKVPGSYTNPLDPPPAEVARKEDQHLYDIAPAGSAYEFITLNETDFTGNDSAIKLRGYSERLFDDNTNFIGSIDPGSDDLHIFMN